MDFILAYYECIYCPVFLVVHDNCLLTAGIKFIIETEPWAEILHVQMYTYIFRIFVIQLLIEIILSKYAVYYLMHVIL